MSRRTHALAAWLCAALAAAAQEPTAPLSASKEQLDALRRNPPQERAAGELGAELRGAVPAMPSPGAGVTAPATPPGRPPKREQDEAAAQRGRDWLVDGFDRLGDGRDRGAGRDEADETPIDPKDPDYFLRLYERERAAALKARRAREGAEGEGSPGATRPDAFAPFMQGWLAGSPVAGVLAESALRRADGPAGNERATLDQRAEATRPSAFASGAAAPGESAAAAVAPLRGAEAAGAPNPYVAALGLDREPVRAVAAPGPATVPAVAPVESMPSLRRAESPRERPAFRPPPSPADDRKYYPQLKKF